MQLLASTSSTISASSLTSTTPQVEAIMSSGLDSSELNLLMDVISYECQELGLHHLDIHHNNDREGTRSTNFISMREPVVTMEAVGALGRVLLLRASGFEFHDRIDLLEQLEERICEQIDMILCDGVDSDGDGDGNGDEYEDEQYGEDEYQSTETTLNDALLVCFQTDDELELKLARFGLDTAGLGIDNDKNNHNENNFELNHDSKVYVNSARYLSSIVANNVQEHELIIATTSRKIQPHSTKRKIDVDNTDMDDDISERSFVPSMHVEMDGGYVAYPLHQNVSTVDDDEHEHEHNNGIDNGSRDHNDGSEYWDTSTLLVFDNLVSQDLRKRLLDVIVRGDSDLEYHDAKNGPDPDRWVRGALMDVPDSDDATGMDNDDYDHDTGNENRNSYGNEHTDEDEDNTNSQGGGWGLQDHALHEICYKPHAAIQDMESILSNLFTDFNVSRLPSTVLGSSITPLTANAPTTGDVFDYHIDADPNLAPSSPWTDVYGRYPNRSRGKPRFMSCLVYLNQEWEEEWGAPTRFVDVPTDDVEDLTVYDVQPRPGRCIIMDQDMGHTVVAPNASAGKRPRYSLVWKLILHPKYEGQDMKDLAGERASIWPDTEYFGSAGVHRNGECDYEEDMDSK